MTVPIRLYPPSLEAYQLNNGRIGTKSDRLKSLGRNPASNSEEIVPRYDEFCLNGNDLCKQIKDPRNAVSDSFRHPSFRNKKSI
jgi:hypothetical protein